MAIYHCQVKTISRADGRTATASAAYRSGEKIKDENTNETHDYTKKKGILHTEIITREDAPQWTRQELWNEVEKAEKRKNSTVAREYELALPSELSTEQQIKLAKDFANHIVNTYGVAADVCIHVPSKDGDERNRHAHILTSTRRTTAEGFGEKSRELDGGQSGRIEIEKIRETWANLTNKALERAGLLERIDHRTLADQGVDRPAQIHQGPTITAMERRGVVTEIGQLNRDLQAKAEAEKNKNVQAELDPHEAVEVPPEKIPESPTKTPDKGGTWVLGGEIPVLGVKDALEAQKRLTARASEISAPRIAKYTEKRAEELLRLEKRIEKLEKEHKEIRESEPKKKIFEFTETFAKRESEWQKAEKAARFACLDAWREKKEFAEVTQRGKNVLTGEANTQAREENPHLVKIIAEEKALKTEQEKQKRLERQHSRGNNRGR